MAETNPIEQPDGSIPTVSMTTLPIAGLKVDIYGLDELPSTAAAISCLWLHHPRLRCKEDMADTAHLILSTFRRQEEAGAGPGRGKRGLIAVAFDQRNHGSRIVDDKANKAWRGGNGTHAQDMFSIVSGTVIDTIHLMDVLEGYLFGAGGGPGAMAGDGQRRIDQNMVLGVSLGGHSAWQLLMADPRVTAGTMVIGCPDYMKLLQDRARKSKLQTYSSDDDGASFIGSTDFPEALVSSCKKFDPKAILFGTSAVPSTISAEDQDRIRPILDARIRGKRFQILSGGADKLVPYKMSAPFLDCFKDAINGWYKDGGVYVEDNVYPKVGHEFNKDMGKDALRFIFDTVAQADGSKATSSKI
ncbi:hypothetical protein F5Y15DRAFT_2645 [Xylariaceae sp. FL0016]|nr:hypothetical protein F5Y15DRAFT_2645 [Xylariaceae sp. FL0016]